MYDQAVQAVGPFALHIHRHAVTGREYPAVAGDGWKLTTSEQALGVRRVELPPELQHLEPAVLLQLVYDGKLDVSGSVARIVNEHPVITTFPEDDPLQGG